MNKPASADRLVSESNADGHIEELLSFIINARKLRELYQIDMYRPRYHFMAPEGICFAFDPNGAIFHRGKYHIFYLTVDETQLVKNSNSLNYSWGHASSVDLLHWHYHPTAIKPDGREVNIASGGSFLDKNGIPTIIYPCHTGIGIAQSFDEDLNEWAKLPENPVLTQPQKGENAYGKYNIGDIDAWFYEDAYHAIINSGRPDGCHLFRSIDMKKWDYISEFYESDLNKSRSLDDCACPSFFKLGNKWVLLYISHYNGVQYYVGEYSGGRFFPEKHEKMNWPGGVFFATESLLDDQNRRIIWGWVPETRSRATQHASGWSGVMSMPRVISLSDDGQINIDPPEEFERLRLNYRKLEDLHLDRSHKTFVKEISGDSLELLMRVAPVSKARFGIKVRCSPDGQEETAIIYDSEKATIAIDTSKSSLRDDITQPFPYPWAAKMPDIEGMVPPFSRNGEHNIKNVFLQEVPFSVGHAECLELRIYIDRSILEMYANSRICLTQRIYPSSNDSTGIKLFCEMGNAVIDSLEAWDIAPTNHW